MSDAIINSRNPYEIQEIEIEVELSGYFYLKTTGKFVSNIGTSQNCYAVREKKNMYVKSEVEALNIKHDDFTYICGVLIKEDPDTFETMAALVQTTFNAVKLKKGDFLSMEEQAIYAKKLLSSNYSSVPVKTPLQDSDSNQIANDMRRALIHVLLAGYDYSNGSIVWDGIDFVILGKNHPKSKWYGGISITKQIWNSFIDVWFPKDNDIQIFDGKTYTKSNCKQMIPFITKTEISEREEELSNIKKECPNLHQVTENLFETCQIEIRTGYPNLPNGEKKFIWIINKANVIYGNSIFWIPDKNRNKGYIWKNYFPNEWFE